MLKNEEKSKTVTARGMINPFNLMQIRSGNRKSCKNQQIILQNLKF